VMAGMQRPPSAHNLLKACTALASLSALLLCIQAFVALCCHHLVKNACVA
jgi:hypothetical protein